MAIEPLLTDICMCKGDLSFVHQSCLIKWLKTKNIPRCEICLHDYKITFKLKPLKKVIPIISYITLKLVLVLGIFYKVVSGVAMVDGMIN